jgi:hypothetical protein
MNAQALSLGQIVAAISAVALVVSLFLAWGGAGGDAPEVPALPEGAQGLPGASEALEAAEDATEATGWESQNTLDIYLAILAGLVLLGVAMTLAGYPEGLPFAPAAGTFLLGVIGTVMTVYVLIDVPEGLERKIGLYLATAAVIGVTIGSFLQMRDEVAESY